MGKREYRCRHDLIRDALTVAVEPLTPTDFYWKSRMSGRVYSKTRELVFKAGLLERLADGRFHTTDKGLRWLRAYRRLEKLVEAEA